MTILVELSNLEMLSPITKSFIFGVEGKKQSVRELKKGRERKKLAVDNKRAVGQEDLWCDLRD